MDSPRRIQPPSPAGSRLDSRHRRLPPTNPEMVAPPPESVHAPPIAEPSPGVARIEAFCDGVFAIAITLLVLEIRVPTQELVGAEGLWRALGRSWPSYVAYVLSFAIIGIMWANHRNIFRYIGRSNHTFVILNVAPLLCTAFLPFPTAVLARYLLSATERTAAAAFYGGTLTVTAVVYNALWRYAAAGRRLLRADADQQLVNAVTREYFFGPVLYLAATLVAFLSVWVSLGIHAFLAGLFVVPNRSRP